MSPEELLADTNRVLHELLILEREKEKEREKNAASLKDFKASWAERKEKLDEKMKGVLVDRGVPEEAAEVTEDDWEKRSQAVQQKSRENLAVMSERTSRFNEELIAEMKIQSDLLRQIAAKLEG